MSGRALALGVSAAIAIAAASGTACGPSEATATTEAAQTELDHGDWLEKASKVLRNGDGLGPRDDTAALLAMPKEAVVDLWMNDPRFGDTVLGFNLYYLGRSVDAVKRPRGGPQGGFSYVPMVFAVPQALAAARAVVTGGDYFELYRPRLPFYRQTNGRPPAGQTGGVATERARIAGLFGAAITAFEAGTLPCARFDGPLTAAQESLVALGFHPASALLEWIGPASTVYPDLLDCKDASTPARVARMQTITSEVDRLYAMLESEPAAATVSAVGDVRAIDLPAPAGLPGLVRPLTAQGFWETLPGTSTNFHRKRASYVLKTYFCDDLTPLDVPTAGSGDTADGGASDAHASQGSCQACHYRLDPIGALFRSRGRDGRDFAGSGKVAFDDNVTFRGPSLDEYLGQWRSPDGSFRAGYWVLGADGKPRRDAGWTDADGDSLDGLWSYLPRSKVVQSCLVRRLAEYVLGPQQVYDRAWLGEVSADFSSGPGSGEGFRRVLKRLVLGKTFATHDPKPGECYDVPANAAPNRSPCAIAHVVSTHCAGCHGSTAGPGRLDFKSWIALPDGTFSWAHLDASGEQVPRAVSLQRVLDRITTPDRSIRMPLQRAMPEADTATFRNWLTVTLQGTP